MSSEALGASSDQGPESLELQLSWALHALKRIAGQPPTLMHNEHQHEVLVYSAGHNPTKMAREALVTIEAVKQANRKC